MEQGTLAVPATESVTLMVNGYDPRTVGVPLTTPVDVFRLRPGGKLPEVRENVYGGVPWEAGKAWE